MRMERTGWADCGLARRAGDGALLMGDGAGVERWYLVPLRFGVLALVTLCVFNLLI